MLIPLIEKDAAKNDFTCRDGEIELVISTSAATPGGSSDGSGGSEPRSRDAERARAVRFAMEEALPYPTATIRVALQSGDGAKCALMLGGEASRVDAASADRITQAIVAKAAVAFADILADARAAGLFMLPVRAFSYIAAANGSHSYPSAQAILLPSEYPPHPEITASHTEDDGVTLSLRVPVRPQKLTVRIGETRVSETEARTYVSRPLWVPDAKEISGTLGSVRSAGGGTAMGIRFSFMSESRLKGSVVAPDKYYRYIGNDPAGYHITSETISKPDYSPYREVYGTVPPFPADALRAVGTDTEPLSWIADWTRSGDGYLPTDTVNASTEASEAAIAALDPSLSTLMAEMKAMTGYGNWLLTRPMTFAADEQSRRHAEATALKSLRVYGLVPGAATLGILLGSSDGRTYEPIMTFSPSCEAALLAPHRPFWRLLLGSSAPLPALCLEVNEE